MHEAVRTGALTCETKEQQQNVNNSPCLYQFFLTRNYYTQ